MKKILQGWAAAAAILLPVSAWGVPTQPALPDHSTSDLDYLLGITRNAVVTPPELMKDGRYVLFQGLEAFNPDGTVFVCSRTGEANGPYASQESSGRFFSLHRDPADGSYDYVMNVDGDASENGRAIYMKARLTPSSIRAYDWKDGLPVILGKQDIQFLHKMTAGLISNCDAIRKVYAVEGESRSVIPVRYALPEAVPAAPAPALQKLKIRGFGK